MSVVIALVSRAKLEHMGLMGCPNPYELQESWECTFLKVFTFENTNEHKKDFTDRF